MDLDYLQLSMLSALSAVHMPQHSRKRIGSCFSFVHPVLLVDLCRHWSRYFPFLFFFFKLRSWSCKLSKLMLGPSYACVILRIKKRNPSRADHVRMGQNAFARKAPARKPFSFCCIPRHRILLVALHQKCRWPRKNCITLFLTNEMSGRDSNRF